MRRALMSAVVCALLLSPARGRAQDPGWDTYVTCMSGCHASANTCYAAAYAAHNQPNMAAEYAWVDAVAKCGAIYSAAMDRCSAALAAAGAAAKLIPTVTVPRSGAKPGTTATSSAWGSGPRPPANARAVSPSQSSQPSNYDPRRRPSPVSPALRMLSTALVLESYSRDFAVMMNAQRQYAPELSDPNRRFDDALSFARNADGSISLDAPGVLRMPASAKPVDAFDGDANAAPVVELEQQLEQTTHVLAVLQKAQEATGGLILMRAGDAAEFGEDAVASFGETAIDAYSIVSGKMYSDLLVGAQAISRDLSYFDAERRGDGATMKQVEDESLKEFIKNLALYSAKLSTEEVQHVVGYADAGFTAAGAIINARAFLGALGQTGTLMAMSDRLLTVIGTTRTKQQALQSQLNARRSPGKP